ncbi:macro domain-containing protein VPA0103-like [Lolium rigidum]|uniref:macro domain-containing protein VPA0103-like n=1 Tax=Lolium rigidum TaxID=89674 RepID=UPI001F5D8F70|nr:macro domain-containing protein VPA0103-like [Lolium rigidum]
MSRVATRIFLTPSLLPLPLPKLLRRRRPSICSTTRAFAMAASGFEGGETFRLSAAAGAGALKLHKGDITLWSVDGATDAIVNAANGRMLGGGGVDGAIHQAAGPQLVQACRKVPEVKPGVRCPTGEARITPAFELPVSRVIHTVGPVYDMDKRPELLLKNAYENSLKLAKENGIQYIAFPAISCGIFRYPPKEASNIAISTARQFSGDIKEVHFVLFTDELYNVWCETAQEMLAQFEK